MNNELKCFNLYNSLDNNFKNKIKEYILKGKIRFFNNDEWTRIENQNFFPDPNIPNKIRKELKSFTTFFEMGLNIGNCVGTAFQLSYSYDNIDIVSGILPILKGTLNAEKEGGHCWLETKDYIIDTSLMLVISKDLKDELGYKEEKRLTSRDLAKSDKYQARKEFTNDNQYKKK